MEVSSRVPAVPPRHNLHNTTPSLLHSTTTTPPRRITQSRTPPPRTSELNSSISPRRAAQSVTPPPLSSSQCTSSTPRHNTQSITPPPRSSSNCTSSTPRRAMQSVTPPPRSSAQSTSYSPRHSTQNVTPPPGTTAQNTTSPRRPTTDITPPPIPARWDMCTYHVGYKYTAICITCVKFLCNKCLLSEIYYHNQCSVVYLSDSLPEACRSLKESVCEKMENVNKSLTNFQTSLCKKRDRMLKKKNETVSEIKHYYNRLRELILSKLRRDEDELLQLMKGKVDEQDEVILEKIQQCCATTSTLHDKHAVIQDLEQSANARNNSYGLEFVKELVSASNYLKECNQVEKDVVAVRDAFLVIRFFVNSETERTVLNSNVACVEVLNSQSENRGAGTLESDRINEVAHIQAISNESVDTSDEERVDDTHGSDRLRVVLPPLNEQILDSNNDVSCTHEFISAGEQHTDVSLEREIAHPLTDRINELVNEFDTRIVNRPENTERSVSMNGLTNEMILSNLQTDTSPTSEREDDNAPEMDLEPTLPNSDEYGENVQNQVPEQSNGRQNPEISVSPPQSSETDRRHSDAVTVDSGSTPRGQIIPVRDDDPPPPYPGNTSYPEPPGPDELPPPYPGAGSPPPYTQMPEAQQPTGRNRLNGESRGDRLSRHFSDSDVQSRPLEITAPTQTSTPRLSRPKASKVFSVNEANDRRVSGIYALASTRDNSFLIIDRWNKKLKYFSSNGASYGGLIFREEPWDITDMTESLVAVTVPKLNTFYKIKVTDSSVITTSTLPTLRSYACISFNKATQLFVCGQVPQFGEPVIDIVGIDGGQIIQSFRSGFNNQLCFSYPRYVKVNEEGTAIVCDWNLKCVIVFKLDGTVVGKYRGTVEFPLNEPTGITYNPTTKEIYVIDAKHNSTLGAIHIVNLNCRCREIVRWDNEFRIARAITPRANGYALGNKSGVLSIFETRQRR